MGQSQVPSPVLSPFPSIPLAVATLQEVLAHG